MSKNMCNILRKRCFTFLNYSAIFIDVIVRSYYAEVIAVRFLSLREKGIFYVNQVIVNYHIPAVTAQSSHTDYIGENK